MLRVTARPIRALLIATLLAVVTPAVVAPVTAGASPARAALKITTTALPAPTAGAPYTTTLAATGGLAPYHWSIASGRLPIGLSLSAAGVLSGNPPTSLTAAFTAKVVDAETPVAAVASRAFGLDIGPQQVYVANQAGNTVTEYGIAPKGNAPPVAAISGPTTGPANPGAIAVGGDGEVYVADSNANAIYEYAPGATGPSPVHTLSGPDTRLSSPRGIALDQYGNLYVTNDTPSVTEYAPHAYGDSSPDAVIAGDATGLTSPSGIAIDPNGRIVVGAGLGYLEVFPPDATGNFNPLYELGGDATEIQFAIALAYNPAGELYVLSRSQDGSAVLLFGPGTVGNVAPSATIFGADTRLLNSGGIALDSFGRVYVTNQDTQHNTAWVSVYTAGATGDSFPIAVLQGKATGLDAPVGIAIGSPLYQTTTTTRLQGGTVGTKYSETLTAALGVAPYRWRIFSGALPPGLRLSPKGVISGTPTAAGVGRFTVEVADSAVPNHTIVFRPFSINIDVPFAIYVANSDLATNSIAAFAVPGFGNVAPFLTISGPHTGLSQPQAIAFDATARLYVANYDGSVTEYNPNASGDASPIATISGPLTGLYTPSAIAVDQSGDILVANELGGTVTEYAPGAHGNVAPLFTLTGLSDPSALAFDPEGRFWVNSGDTLEAFDTGASGNATPVATLAGPDTGLSGIKGIVFDADGWLHVSNLNSGMFTTYLPFSQGDAAPYKSVSLALPWGAAVDAFGDVVVASDAAPYGLFAYDRFGGSTTTVAQGSMTTLSQPTGVAVPPQ